MLQLHNSKNHAALSFSDCSLLELAIRLNATLITSDKKLKNIAHKNAIVVMGLLGVIKQLFESKLINRDFAIEKLHDYLRINSWAPVEETKNLLREFQYGSNTD